MKYLTFKNGDKIPMLGLGTWKAEEGIVYDAILSAIETGYRHFDCAHIYGNEKEIGRAFKDAYKKFNLKREDLWITSKLWCDSHRLEQVEPALQVTLNNLQTDYLDLYLIHWPIAMTEFNGNIEKAKYASLDEISLAETWEGMILAKNKGLAKHIGVSNFSTTKMNQLIHETREKPEVNQVEIHPYLNQAELKELADSEGFFLTGYKPIGSGGKTIEAMETKGVNNLFDNPIIKRIADNSNMTSAQVLILWQIQRGIICIPKSTNIDRQKENFEALNYHLSDEQMEEINELNKNIRFVDGSAFCHAGSPYSPENIWH